MNNEREVIMVSGNTGNLKDLPDIEVDASKTKINLGLIQDVITREYVERLRDFLESSSNEGFAFSIIGQNEQGHLIYESVDTHEVFVITEMFKIEEWVEPEHGRFDGVCFYEAIPTGEYDIGIPLPNPRPLVDPVKQIGRPRPPQNAPRRIWRCREARTQRRFLI